MKRPLKRLKCRYRTYILVSLVFVILGIGLHVLVRMYWDRLLEPRLLRESASQADVLAHSQALRLAEALIVEVPGLRNQALQEAVDEILLFSGLHTGRPLFLGLGLEIDYDVVPARRGSLDRVHGNTDCPACFVSDVALYSPHTDELLGIARFHVSDRLYLDLSRDVQQSLFTQSRLGILLLVLVWAVTLHLIREVNRARFRAEEANRAKSTFLANISHELRTPLNAVIGFSELMNRDPAFSRSHRENLTIIHRSGTHLLELINDILALSRMEAIKERLRETRFDLWDTLDNVARMIRPRVADKGLYFTLEKSDDLPRTIRTDPRRLRQILLNLVGNAVKFTDKGRVTLRAGLAGWTGDNVLVLAFEVEDTGPGIRPREREKIFDAFTQTREGAVKREGTGLGLAISRRFVRQMGGDIRVSGREGRGSTFHFTIRALPAEPAPIRPEPGPAPLRGPVRPKAGQTIRAALAALPRDCLAALEKAIKALDYEAAAARVQGIRKQDPRLAGELDRHLTAYRFDKLQALLEEASPKKE